MLNIKVLLRAALALSLLALAACAGDGEESEGGDGGAVAMGPGTYLSRLNGWKEEPKLMLEECAKLDPAGQSARRKIYDTWASSHSAELNKISQYMVVVPRKLYASHAASGESPEDYFRSKTMLDLNQLLFFMSADEKRGVCTNFANSSSLGPDLSRPTVSESFVFLDGWMAQNARR